MSGKRKKALKWILLTLTVFLMAGILTAVVYGNHLLNLIPVLALVLARLGRHLLLVCLRRLLHRIALRVGGPAVFLVLAVIKTLRHLAGIHAGCS